MASRAELLQELDRRGKLPDNLRPAFEEARRRGLIGGPTPEQRQANTDAMADASVRSQFGRQPVTGLMENIGAGFDNGVNQMLGSPVDLPVWLANQGIGATNTAIGMTGSAAQIPTIPVDLPGSRIGYERLQQQAGFTPPSAVEPADEGQRLARAASEAVAMSVVPEAAAIKAGQVVTQAGRAVSPLLSAISDAVGSLFGQSRTAGQFAKNAAINAASGVGGQAGADLAPDALKPVAGIAGSIIGGGTAATAAEAPRAAKAVASVAGDVLAPITTAGRERIAGQTLRDSASSPGGVIAAIEDAPAELVPGSRPTTFQQTGDMGLGALERGVAAKNPGEFMQRRTDQNAARLDALGKVAPQGAPEAVAASVRGFLKSIDDEATAAVDTMRQRGAGAVAGVDAQTQGVVDAARRQAQGAANGLGAGRHPDLVGDDLGRVYDTARAPAKAAERRLWQTIDPDGSLALPAANTRQQVRAIFDELTPLSARPEGAEASIYADIQRYGDGVLPFRALTDLDSRLKTAIREERLSPRGESPAWRRMSMLKSAVERDFDEAVAGKVEQEARAVQAGEMRVEDTLSFNVQNWVDDWRARQSQEAVGLDNSGGGRTGPRGGAPGVARISGTEGQAGGRPSGAPRDPGLPPDDLALNFDQAARDRLTAARAATRERVSTFDNPTLKPIRFRTEGNTSGLPGKIFFPGPKSADAIQTYRKAVGDQQAMSLLSDYVVDRLRKTAMRDDGTLDPMRVANFQRTHADALRSFPELNQRFGGAADASAKFPIAEAARTKAVKDATKAAEEAIAVTAREGKQRLDDAQKGALGQIMGLQNPDDVVRTVGAIFSRKDAVNEIGRLRSAIGNSAEAKEGLRKAIVDFVTDKFVSNAEAGTSGANLIKADGFQTFVKSNKNALRMAGLTEDEVKVMQAIADDLRQANRSIVAVKLPGGSNTTQDVLASKANDPPLTMLTKIAMAAAASGGGASLFGGPLVGAAAFVGTGVLGAMRQAGLSKVDDIIRDAMLNPTRARLLMQKATPKQQKQIEILLRQQYRRAAVASAAAANGDDQGRI